MKIAHIVNPVLVTEDSDLYTAQAITYETMRTAKEFAKNEVEVELFGTIYEEDELVFPDGFARTNDLERSVADVNEYESFKLPRKLPLFRDILDRLYVNTEADYMVQTNADICLMPHFYVVLKRFIEFGYDSFIVNKRIISKLYSEIEEIPQMYSELGEPHNGYDCFVFRRDIYPKFDIGDICMGIPWSETTLASSMVAYSEECNVFKNLHLTFHIGDSRTWLTQEQNDYRQHNTEEFAKVLNKIIKRERVKRHPIIHWFLYKLSQELQVGYSQECHDVVRHLKVPITQKYIDSPVV